MENGMNIRSTTTREKVQLALFLIFFVFTVFLNVTCSSEEDNPTADNSCGSGHVFWDDKGGVCRDQVDNRVVPSNCCGR